MEPTKKMLIMNILDILKKNTQTKTIRYSNELHQYLGTAAGRIIPGQSTRHNDMWHVTCFI